MKYRKGTGPLYPVTAESKKKEKLNAETITLRNDIEALKPGDWQQFSSRLLPDARAIVAKLKSATPLLTFSVTRVSRKVAMVKRWADGVKLYNKNGTSTTDAGQAQ